MKTNITLVLLILASHCHVHPHLRPGRPAGIQVLVYVLTLAIVGTLMAMVGRTSSASRTS